MQQLRQQINNITFFALVFAGLLFPALASASTGTVLTGHQYAWSDVGGYVNFAPTKSVVHVSDTALTGYAWSENDGWIKLDPANGGVLNNKGVLKGFAWDETSGWISFAGVTIDSYGVFHGVATGANVKISFDCARCDVRTDWRQTENGVITPVPGGSNAPNPIPGETVATTTKANIATSSVAEMQKSTSTVAKAKSVAVRGGGSAWSRMFSAFSKDVSGNATNTLPASASQNGADQNGANKTFVIIGIVFSLLILSVFFVFRYIDTSY